MPGSPQTRSAYELTGRRRHRLSCTGALVLQVEETCRTGTAEPDGPHYTGSLSRWRDAVLSDLSSDLT